MKSFLTTLLMVFALALCGLVAFQWNREVRLRQRLQMLVDEVQDQKEAIQNLNGLVKRTQEEVDRLEAIRKQLTATIQTNMAELSRLDKELDKALRENEQLKQQVDVYKEALTQANENIERQNQIITQQNEEMKKLAEERNAIVAKYNDLVQQFNDLVQKWNAQQEALAAAATNAPSPPRR